MLLMDADHVSRVLVNRIGNAIKHTPEGGKVDFIAACKKLKNGKVRHEYAVADNGIGMSDAFQKKMFSLLSRSRNSAADIHSVRGWGCTL